MKKRAPDGLQRVTGRDNCPPSAAPVAFPSLHAATGNQGDMSAPSCIQHANGDFVQCEATCCLFICGRDGVTSTFSRQRMPAASDATPRVFIVRRRRPRGWAWTRPIYNRVVRKCGVIREGEKFGGRGGRTSRLCFESVSTKVAKIMKKVKMCQVVQFLWRYRLATPRAFQPWHFGRADRRSACVVTPNVGSKWAFSRHVRAPCEVSRTKWRKATAPGRSNHPRGLQNRAPRVRLQKPCV